MEAGTPDDSPLPPSVNHEPRQGRRVPPAVAEAAMREAGAEPLASFPGIRLEWLCRCLVCSREIRPTYFAVRRGRAACGYCDGKIVDPEDAARMMEAAGFTPLAPYPGTHEPWPCVCKVCGEADSPTHHTVKGHKISGGCRKCRLANRPKRVPEDAVARMGAAGFIPLVPWPGRDKPWLSRCMNCDEECEPKYKSVTNGLGLGCRKCSAARQSRRRVDPVVAVAEMRAVGLEPLTPFTVSGNRWKCRCLECGEVVYRRHDMIRFGASGGCRHPLWREAEALAGMEAACLKPLDPYPDSDHLPWRAECKLCHRVDEYLFRAVRARKAGKGCSACAGAVTDPAVAESVMLQRGLRPLCPYPGAMGLPWAYECITCGRIDERPLFQVKIKGYGCPACEGSLFDVDAAIALMREHGFEPLIPFPGSNEPWRCRCHACGKETTPTYSRVRIRGQRCGKCSGRSLTEEELVERMLISGYTPLVPFPGNRSIRWPSTCNRCGGNVAPTYARATSGASAGCCLSPYDLTRPGRQIAVYLITHDRLNAAKIGIAVVVNGRCRRLGEHGRHGWQVYAQWTDLASLAHALDVERAVMEAWRAQGLSAHLTKVDMPQDGHTETVRLDRVDLDDVVALVNESRGAADTDGASLSA